MQQQFDNLTLLLLHQTTLSHDPFCPCRMSNSTRIFHRSRAQLKRTECSSRIPPEWKVEYFLNHSNAEEGEDKNSTEPPSVATSSTPLPLLGRYVISP